jgi:hypothetical protein
MRLLCLIRSVGERKFKRRDGSDGRSITVTVEVDDPMSLMTIELRNEHDVHEKKYAAMVGKRATVPVQFFAMAGKTGAFLRITSSGDGAPHLAPSVTAQAA